MCSSDLDKGGVGILNLKIQNEALLLKSLDKFYNHADTPWVDLIWQTHYMGKIPHAMKACGSFWWRDVTKLMPIFRGISHCLVGNGSSILFWKDSWGDIIASDGFPRAFSFARDEDVSVQKFLSADSLGANFHLPLSPKALQEISSLILIFFFFILKF